MEKLGSMVKEGDAAGTVERVRELLQGGAAPESLLRDSMIPAMDEVGELFQKGEYYMPEMLVAARAMQAGLDILKPLLVKRGVKSSGKVVVGTVAGDLHDIGKNLVVIALEGAGFEVIDLGVDITPEAFVEAVKAHRPRIVGLSALLTTTMPAMRKAVEAIKRSGSADGVRIMVGGAPVTKTFADEIGADYYGQDAVAGKTYAQGLVG